MSVVHRVRRPPNSPLLRRITAIAALAIVVASIGIGTATPAGALAAPTVASILPMPTRIQGVDRYDQAVQVSAAFSRASIAYLASGEKFADALSAAAVAAHHGSPLLLTPRDSIPDGVIGELVRLQPQTIVVVGGTASVSDGVAEQVSQRVSGTVVRIDGQDRYEVSRRLLSDPVVGAGQTETVFMATGATFPDALTASPAAARTGSSAVLLVNGSEPAATDAERAVLEGLGATGVHLVGGVNSLSPQLEASLGQHFRVTRSAGADRYEAGVAVNRDAFSTATRVYLASGTAFPDALSGGPLAAAGRAPLYVVQPGCVPISVLDELARLKPAQIVVLGGPNTLGSGVDALTPC